MMSPLAEITSVEVKQHDAAATTNKVMLGSLVFTVVLTLLVFAAL